jgi:hypothetical protein
MQNRYVGDVGDYGKYALLRGLCDPDARPAVRLGVVWCLFPDETFNNDGKHISYLKDPQFAQLDIDLHAALAVIVSTVEEVCLPFASTPVCQRRLFTFPSQFRPPTESRLARRNALCSVTPGFKRVSNRRRNATLCSLIQTMAWRLRRCRRPIHGLESTFIGTN